jgi:hypothetical protein
LFKSVLVDDVGDALDTTIGTLRGLGDENDGVKSAKDTICGPLGVTALPCRCFGGGGFTLSCLWLS